jgi:hypothetical protein
MREISKLHGVPKKIVFDRDPKFTSNLWKGLFKRFGKFFIFSTSYLIQMDIGGHPPIPTGSHVVLIIGNYFLDFQVLNFQGHFEALNNIFGVRHSQTVDGVGV